VESITTLFANHLIFQQYCLGGNPDGIGQLRLGFFQLEIAARQAVRSTFSLKEQQNGRSSEDEARHLPDKGIWMFSGDTASPAT
jgi:hypothetical protein